MHSAEQRLRRHLTWGLFFDLGVQVFGITFWGSGWWVGVLGLSVPGLVLFAM